jgi:hypothetical protein
VASYPCGNCRDAEKRCLRERQNPSKRLKGPPADKLRSSASDSTIPEVNTALNTHKSRIARLEEAATYCHYQNREDGDHVSRSNLLRDPLHFDSAVTGASDNLLTSKKRNCAESHALSSLTVAVPADPELPSKQSSGADDVKLPHSAVDARDLIQDQLSFNNAISARQLQSFRSALANLSDALRSKATMDEGHWESRQVWSYTDSEIATSDWITPPLATVQWMLTSASLGIALNGSSLCLLTAC